MKLMEKGLIKKAVIAIAGLGTRFLPLSKVLPKELWPLVDKPIIHYLIKEVRDSGISEIIFVLNPKKKFVLDYLKKSPGLEKILKERKKDHLLKVLQNLEEIFKDISFSYVFQKQPLGNGHAVLQTAKQVGQEPFAIVWGDDVVDSQIPCLLQLEKVFKTSQKPVMALYRVPKERITSYSAIEVEKIATRLYKVKKIIEKPKPEQIFSDLTSLGRYIMTPEVFEALAKAKPSKGGEIWFAEVLDRMIQDGKIIYGYEIEGKWLECGNKENWLKSHLYLSLKHSQFGPKLREFLKEIK